MSLFVCLLACLLACLFVCVRAVIPASIAARGVLAAGFGRLVEASASSAQADASSLTCSACCRVMSTRAAAVAEEQASLQSAHRPEDAPGTPARDKSSRGSDDQASWHKGTKCRWCFSAWAGNYAIVHDDICLAVLFGAPSKLTGCCQGRISVRWQIVNQRSSKQSFAAAPSDSDESLHTLSRPGSPAARVGVMAGACLESQQFCLALMLFACFARFRSSQHFRNTRLFRRTRH